MTAFVLDRIAALPPLARGARGLLSRLGSAIDNAVAALAARKLSETEMEEADRAVKLYLRPGRKKGSSAGVSGSTPA